MRSIALRTKTVLAALAGVGVLALGAAAALPATGLHSTSSSHSVRADEGRGPGVVHA
ncbi:MULTISPECIES: hypothetical protein [unclassified Streptomyces]|uniref:hypothetical protein n=1 Tax=unclassified Streptomyces TaxID=2593676 RepID=UPI000DC5D41F|nr:MULTISPECIES: hypothetical protein [unclassified Streptomyces]MYU04255.1 hypothetical protein [Streptomyces sp. SID8366]MYU61495.1 hypothetical protein [Streptomyces sp. SID69]RAJ49848.1 hypothetical protein K376_06726 [Streptomyces sp. PsTaAH-130]